MHLKRETQSAFWTNAKIYEDKRDLYCTRPHPTIQADVMDGDGNLRAADIGITWEGNETFLHGVKVVGPQFPRPVGPGPVMSTPYPQEDKEDRSNSSTTAQPPTPAIPVLVSDTDGHVRRPPPEVRQGYRPAAPIQRFNNKSLNWPAWFRHHWNRYFGINITTHTGHQTWIAVYRRRGVPSITPQGCCIIRTCVHRGTLLDSTVFGGSSSLYHSYCGWPVDATQWTAGRFDRFLGEYRPGSGPDTGGPIGMEGASVGVKLWAGDCNGGAIF